MTMNAPPGVFDIVPFDSKEKWRNSFLWNYVEEIVRQTAKQFGYQEIRTPAFERTELFQRGVGETSDVISKEMYTFTDKGGRSLSLRPEGTAPVIRALIEGQAFKDSSTQKLFYIAPMFRYERSQAGRYRQHHQFGAEAIGNSSPEQDVEIIDLLYTVYQRLGLKNLQLCLNCLGDSQCRLNYRQSLQDYLRPYLSKLSSDSKVRFEANPLRILDSKDPHDQEILLKAPSILDCLSEESKQHFSEVQTLLNAIGIPFVVTPKLVRGLDYYNRTVFEITSGELGAQNSVGGGGRYDGLVELLGGPSLPAIGFGTGIERIIQTMLKQEIEPSKPSACLIYFIPLGSAAKKMSFNIVHGLRNKGIPAQLDLSGKKLNKAMQYANQIQAKFVVVFGDNELNSSIIDVKDMFNGSSHKIGLHHLENILKIELESAQLMPIWDRLSKPFESEVERDFFINRMKNTISHTQTISKQVQNTAQDLNKILNLEI